MCTKKVDIKKVKVVPLMRITQEADYAIRICIVLDSKREKMGATAISEIACIPQKFALKILRKLNEQGIVRSFKGAYGGYELAISGSELKILDIIETIDGPVMISKCLDCDYNCTRNARKSNCKMHIAFATINKKILNDLASLTVGMINDENISAFDIVEFIQKH